MRLIAEDGGRQWPSLADYAASLRPEDWEEATWPSQQGGHTVYVHSVRTWARKSDPTQRPGGGGPLLGLHLGGC